jgi:hypothetical protein
VLVRAAVIVGIALVLIWILKPGLDQLVDRYQDQMVAQVSPTPTPSPTPEYATLPVLMPTSAPTPTPAPTVAPMPTATPVSDRQFEIGDRVRWLIGGGYIAEGVVQSYHLPEPGYWIYTVLRNNGQIWHSVEENRLTLVIAGVSPDFQHEVKGLMVMYFDLLTREELGRGLVLRVVKHPDGPAYDVLEFDCKVHSTRMPGRQVRTVLANERPITYGCDITTLERFGE